MGDDKNRTAFHQLIHPFFDEGFGAVSIELVASSSINTGGSATAARAMV